MEKSFSKSKKFLYMSLTAATLLSVGGGAVYSATVAPQHTVSAAVITEVGIFVKVDGVQKLINEFVTASPGETVTVTAPKIAGYTPDVPSVKLTFDNHLIFMQNQLITYTKTGSGSQGGLTASNRVVYINKAGGATVYSDQATTKATDKTLGNTTAWKFFSVVKDSAGKIVAYNLGGKQYVKAAEVSTSSVKVPVDVFTVHYSANAKWSIAVYNSDLKVQKLIPAGSRWRTFGTKTLSDGKSYYNLGGNQWVRTDYGFWNAK